MLGRFVRDGHDANIVYQRLATTTIEIVPFIAADARLVAELLPLTQARGLSLGDRACLALARRRGIPALSADRSWAELPLDIDIKLIQSPA